MKTYILILCVAAALTSCNNGDSGGTNGSDTTAAAKTNAAANDSTQTPDGITNGSAISTNPNATKTDTTQKQ